MIYVSTTSEKDLGSLDDERLSFERIPDEITEDERWMESLLSHPHRWFLICRYGGCSCHFRHLDWGLDIEFTPPADWNPEDEDDIESTQAAYNVFLDLLSTGHEVDLIDARVGTVPEAIKTLEVDLSKVPRESFRFYNEYRFEFLKR